MEVNRQLEFRGLLHGQVARPGTVQDLVNEHGCPTPHGSSTSSYVPVGHEVWPFTPNRRQPLRDHKVPNPLCMPIEQWLGSNHEGLSVTVRYGAKGALEVVGSVNLYQLQRHPQFLAHRLQRSEHRRFYRAGRL